jgi:hypothetical protein
MWGKRRAQGSLQALINQNNITFFILKYPHPFLRLHSQSGYSAKEIRMDHGLSRNDWDSRFSHNM